MLLFVFYCFVVLAKMTAVFFLIKRFFAQCCLFGLFLFPSQSQHSHLVIQQLLGHLDANSKNSAKVRAGIVEVLLEAAAIASSGSVGETERGGAHYTRTRGVSHRTNQIENPNLFHCLVLQAPLCWRCSTPCCGSCVSAATTS